MSRYDYLGLKRSKEQLAYKDAIRDRDNYTCQICGGPGYDVDHIIPWDESHDSSPSNLRVLCHRCNCAQRKPRKDARLPIDDWWEWVEAEQKRLTKEAVPT